jgi:hypothetical protein
VDEVISIVGPIVILAIMIFGGAVIAKGGLTMWRTPSDGDSVTNRLLGQGPGQEVLRASPYDRVRSRLRLRAERRRSGQR